MTYFHLGTLLLRSARSILDETAIVLRDKPTPAMTNNP